MIEWKILFAEIFHYHTNPNPSGYSISLLSLLILFSIVVSSCSTSDAGTNSSQTQTSIEQVFQTPVKEPDEGFTLTSTITSDQELMQITDIPERKPDVNSELPISSISNSTSLPIDMAPVEILRELWFVAGGIGACGCGLQQEEPSYSIIGETPVELHEQLYICLCGWRHGEKINVKSIDTNGEFFGEKKFIYGSPGDPVYRFKTDVLIHDPGDYEVYIEGESSTLSKSISVIEPEGPRFYFDDNGRIILYNFVPKENVVLYSYIRGDEPMDSIGRFKYELYAWHELQVDENGSLVAKPEYDNEIYFYIAIGETTGEVAPNYESSPQLTGIILPSIVSSTEIQETPAWPVSSDGISACHFSKDDILAVDTNARLWSIPDVINGTLVVTLPKNNSVRIISGPSWGRIRKDIDKSGWWWEVYDDTGGFSGWIWQNRILECQN